MQTNMPLVAALGDLLQAAKTDAAPEIERALDQLCALINVSQTVVYLCSEGGEFNLAYRSSPKLPDPSATLPEILPAKLVSTWLHSVLERRPVQIFGAEFLVWTGPDSADFDMRHTQNFILFPMALGGQLVGVACYAVLSELHTESDAAVARLGDLTDILQTLLAHAVSDIRLGQMERQAAVVVASLQDQVFEVDADGRFTGFFAGPEVFFTGPTQALARQSLLAAVPRDMAQVMEKALHDVMEHGAVHAVPCCTYAEDGARHFELGGRRNPADAAGKPPGVTFVVRDTTHDAWIRAQLRRLNTVVQSMDSMAAILDPNFCPIWVNSAFETHSGWRLDEIKDRNLWTVLRAAQSDAAVVAEMHAATEKRLAFEGEAINQDRNGKQYWVNFSVQPLFDADNVFQGYVSIETVVSNLKEQEFALIALAQVADSAHMRLINAIHALPDSVVIYDAEDRIVAVNAAYHRAFPELAAHSVVGVKLSDLLRFGLEKGSFLSGKTEAEKEAWLHARVADYHKPYSEDEVQLPDGRWLQRINSRTADGGIIAMGIDITAKRNQIAALDAANSDLTRVLADRDRAEQRMSNIIDGAAVGTWELDVVSKQVHVGGHWGEIIGLETATLTDLTMSGFVAMLHPDDQSKIVDADDFGHDLGNQIVNTEFRMRHSDGHWVWILSRCRVSERAADGAPLRISGVHLDINEQKQLEQDVFASRAFLLDVMDASSSAIVVLDGSRKISYVNHEAERIFGLICKLEPGQAFDLDALKLQRVDGGPLSDEDSPFSLALRAVQPVRNIQVGFLHHNGWRGTLSFNAALLDMGAQKFGVVSFSDITESLAATQSLQEALVRAEDMSRAKSTFLANMSHEIRTPLNGVLGMAEVLADIVAEPLHRQMIDTIRKSGETLLTVLNGILDMSKIEAGKMVLETAPFVPLDMVRQAEAIYAIAAEEKGVEFEVLATAGSDKPRLGDAHRLMQVLNNLLNNAFKFTASGKVTLKFSCRLGRPVQIEVSDTGIGMDASQVSRVFESFEQADGSTTRRFGGTGLGLSIVRQLVTLMGGSISAESTPGKGSVFRISLPLPEADNLLSPQMKPKEAAMREDALAGVRILSADDNATNRLVLSEMLAKTGAIVTQVENGQEAIDAWVSALDRNEPFALLLLDITMPVMDGITALAEIRAIEAARGLTAVSAVAVTAHAMPTQVADYLVGGFDTHLPKPFRRLDLLHALHSLLRM